MHILNTSLRPIGRRCKTQRIIKHKNLRGGGGGDGGWLLGTDAGNADGADEGGNALDRDTGLVKPRHKPGPLGGAADQTHMGDAGIAQGGIGEGQIKGMAVTHDEDETSSGNIAQLCNGIASHQSHVLRHGARVAA